MLTVFLCMLAVAVTCPFWFPALMWLFGMMMGVFGAAIGLLSALFALAIVGGVLATAFVLPALLLLALVVWLLFPRQKRLPSE
ncbi:hypothetical protein SAMN05880590_102361 [Rhizobium sp. RU35A]|uniref:hypothetical protein n=1 Tax=Rhizobium sp. RU35A TaxID=1907414 RepID=UPI00095531D1|nr:hypothetical protein [Rhizobium sp. RU35A]SIQ16471.1 hypothetical protein SAMN05880590_102361 [Rhizobium sp. RU35A]